jgi:hypothetical protein
MLSLSLLLCGEDGTPFCKAVNASESCADTESFWKIGADLWLYLIYRTLRPKYAIICRPFVQRCSFVNNDLKMAATSP